MRKEEKGRVGKGKQPSSEKPKGVTTGGGRLARNLQNENDQEQCLSKKRKLMAFKESSCKDASCMSPSGIKKRKVEKFYQDTKNQQKSSSGGVYSNMCHQCQRKHESVANCTMCRTKRFCIKCITKWYPLLSVEEVSGKCPVCRGYCNCKGCLRRKTNMFSRREMQSTNEVKHAWHVVHYLYSWLREFHEHQNAEKRMEAENKGVDAHDLIIPEVKYKSEHICCYKCNAYIVDFHWTCRNCTCILCLSCCIELLELNIPTTSEALPCVGSDKWVPDSDNDICEIPVLELKSVLGESFISKLYEEVTGIITKDPKFEGSVGTIRKCCCPTKSVGKNDVYCPTAKEAKGGHIGHFEFHWVRGEPVIVKDVLEPRSGLSWDPMVIWRVLRDTKSNEGQGPKLSALVVDCRDWTDMEMNMHQFFMGYQEGRSHENGCPQLLRLKHCYDESSFTEQSPRHEGDFLNVVPFPEYTHPWNGPLNLVSYLPLDKPRPQIGPKIDIAYGFHEELGVGDSVIKLHYDMHDVVNVLMHTLEGHHAVMQHKIFLRNDKFKKDKVQNIKTSDDYGGALWDIWRREDVPKLQDYLTKHMRDFKNHASLSSCLADGPIRYESVYLTMEHKRKLKDEYEIEAWTFEQKLGDAVLVPAGCPYQVRNLKPCINVTLGFISPESFRMCLGLADGLRLQSRAKEDKLKVKEMAIYALDKAISCLRSGMLKVGGNEQKVDEHTEKTRNNELVDGNAVSDSVWKNQPGSKQETENVPDPELHGFNGSHSSLNYSGKNRGTVDVPPHDYNLGVLTSPEFQDSDSESVPQKEPNNRIVTMDASELIFNDIHYYVPEPEFYDFDGDRVEKLFKPNQIWAIYGDNDGMPMFYVFIQKVLSLSPFEVRMAFLSSHTNSEFGDVHWVSRGFEKTCGEFHLCQYETNTYLNMFSHQVMWEKGQNGVIKIFPRKGQIWALYRNWSPNWNESTPAETIYKYDIVEILDEYSEKNGITVVPLVKVNGFNAVFRKDPNPARTKQIPREEMFRFCYQIPSYRLTNKDAATKGKKLTGCVELDPAATPLELLEATASETT